MTATLRQSKVATGSGQTGVVTLDAAPLTGSLLVAVGARRQATHPVTFTPTNWAAGPNADARQDGASFDAWTSAYRVVTNDAAAISFTWSSGGGSNVWRIIVLEFTGSWSQAEALAASDTSSTTGGGSTTALGSVAPGVGSGVFVAGGAQRNNTATASAGDGFTEVSDGSDGGVHPTHYAGYKLAPVLPASQSVTITWSGTGGNGGGLLAFRETEAPRFFPRFW